MKLTIPTKLLTKSLEKLRPVFSGKTSLPALGMVKLIANDGLTISANNLDTFCAIKTDAEVSDTGEFAVAGLRLLNAAKSCMGEEIELEAKDKSLHFRSGNSTARMSGLPVAEIPPDHLCEAVATCSMSGSEISQALDETLPFVSVDPTRYILRGIFFESSSKGLSLVATDGCTMAARLIETRCENIAAIVPTNSAKLIASLCGEVRLGFSENAFSAETDEMKIVGKCVEGKFPQWRGVMPAAKEQTTRVNIDRRAFLASLPFLSISDSPTGRFWVNVTIGSDGLSLKSHNPESEGSMEVPAKVTGQGFETRFEASYLARCLSAHHQNEITLLFRDAISPLLIEHDGGQTVVLCMRIQ